MYELRQLLDRFWVTRADNRELYFAIKRALPQYRGFLNEQLGWNLITGEGLVKLEKVPPKAMAWMGIQEFQEPMDYCLLCALLLFLSDLEDGAQFLLSSLTQAAETFTAVLCPVDWTRFSHRKSMVRALRYAQRIGLLLCYDGNSEGFGNDRTQEVLYENTGLSRHFTVHFGRDILRCRTVEDFEAFAWEGEDAERGRQRAQRVYRQLTLAPALYWSEENRGDYDYIKNQRNWIGRHLDEALGGELQVYRNGAYFVLEEDSRFGLYHPRDLALSDAALLLCAHLREQVLAGKYPRNQEDMAPLSRREFQYEADQCRARCAGGWGRQLRQLSLEKLCQELVEYMSGWMLLEQRGDVLLLCPAAGKWVGRYPAAFRGGAEIGEEEDLDEPLEDA